MSLAIVIPTTGRPSLHRLLASIERERVDPDMRVIVVNDRGPGGSPLELPGWAERVAGRGAGPAAARNRGWRACDADWIAFLDDDTELTPGWFTALGHDLNLPDEVAGSQGRIRVARPQGRPPTDAERAVIGLETARYATADMAYRRSVLQRVGGFDERFPRAYREDADLALRVMRAGYRLERGTRETLHPLGADPARTALRRQAGNRDDVLMRAIHGRGWRERAGAPRGRLPRHALITAAAAAAPLAALAGHRRLAAAATAGWLAGSAEFAWARIAPGPRNGGEVMSLVATSLAIPPVAVANTAIGLAQLPAHLKARPDVVLLDRDGTLIVDEPYNGDPARVRPQPGAREALDRLRAAGVRLAVVTNQSGVARGLLTPDQVEAVNRRVEELLGPLGPWYVCPHGEGDGCVCRKPQAGMLRAALRQLGIPPARAAMIGDTGADMQAARTAGVRGVMVPTPVTLPDEVREAGSVAPNLAAAVDLLLGAA
ncbi:MAG TPA: HAD-IIIA family hydrolase [Gaiellales bacterium]|nr:HAD-IIIA family hydrolase [Gaiellales bacterium]